MEELQFDSGVKVYKINGEGELRFNPGDPNIYARFLEAVESIRSIEEELTREAGALTLEDIGIAAVTLLQKADKKMKELLDWVFGSHNDFEKILRGVNLLAVADNGERVITNLFAALEPLLVEGARRCAGEKVQQALAKAEDRRKSQC